MPEIPHDIWVYVAKFLPDNVLLKFFSLNSVFFEIAMAARYGDTTLGDLGSTKTTKKLLRLKDPFVARRVRRLTVHLESNYEFFENWKRKYSHKNTWRLVGRIVKRNAHKPRTAFEEVIQNLADVILGFPNVTDFHVRAREQLLHDHSGPFFAAAWKTFGSHLRTLSIEGDLNCFRIPLSLDRFDQLRELRLEFTDFSAQNNVSSNTKTLRSVVTQAVNKFSPILRSLSVSFGIYTWGHLDLSTFFSNLDPLPLVEQLIVHVPLHKLADHSGLTRILHDHSSTLRHIDLSLDSYFWTRALTTEDRLRTIMEEYCLNEDILGNLETFEFCPTRSGRLDTMTTYLLRSADTLTNLTILNRYLSHEEVTAIVTIFLHRPPNLGLQTLSLYVQFFSPRLLTLLATNLPGLKTLKLRCLDWGVEDHVVPDGDGIQKLDAFQAEMREQRGSFQGWNLRNIAVVFGWSYFPRWPEEILSNVMRVTFGCIPAIQNF